MCPSFLSLGVASDPLCFKPPAAGISYSRVGLAPPTTLLSGYLLRSSSTDASGAPVAR